MYQNSITKTWQKFFAILTRSNHISGCWLTIMEFYRDGDFLFWKWNGQVRGGLSYNGNNTFIGRVNDMEARFELQPEGKAKLFFRFERRRKINLEGIKLIRYQSEHRSI